MDQMDLAADAERWTRLLTALPSVTGSADEARFAGELTRLLRASPAFRDNPERVWRVPVPGGPHPRSAVLALLRGTGPRTVVLTGHFDTVEIESYGPLAPVARDPDRLAAGLAAALEGERRDQQGERALADIRSGDFIFGRGLLDMKAGLAAALAVMEHASRLPARTGNLLFAAVPDEEGNSAGARCLATLLAGLQQELGLAVEAAVNLDAISDDGDGTAGQVVALGSVGKLLPSAFVVGRPVHASYALSGFGAAALAGALAAALECLPALTPRTGAEIASPPTLLGMKDSKQSYDVTTPHSTWMIWNVALHGSGAGDVLERVLRTAQEAVDRFASELKQRRTTITGIREEAVRVPVVTFASLFGDTVGSTPGFAAEFQASAARLAESGVDLPEQCRRLTELTWQASGRQGPAVVLGFASTPYPAAELRSDALAARLEAAARRAARIVGDGFATGIGVVRYFPGISDMSFLGQADTADVPLIAENTPAWTTGVAWPDGDAVADLPMVNAGPWGRDYHTRLERANRRYTFEVLPVLLQEIIAQVLGTAGEQG